MLQGRIDLVLELVAPDGAAAPAGACGIAGLEHEVWDDAVEDAIGVVGTGHERGEVLAGAGSVGDVEFEGYGALESMSHVSGGVERGKKYGGDIAYHCGLQHHVGRHLWR